MKRRSILLYSGGLDSYIAWFYLGKPKTLYCDLGHKYSRMEREAIRDTIPETIVSESLRLVDWEEADANIPMRNLFLCSIAAYYADDIFLVVQKGEMEIPDRTRRFFKDTGALLSFLNKRKIVIDGVFPHFTKTQAVKWYLEEAGLLGGDLHKTHSCYSSSDIPCGNCGACFRRWVAMCLNDYYEPYLVFPWESEIADTYIKRLRRGIYKGQRAKEIKHAFETRGIHV